LMFVDGACVHGDPGRLYEMPWFVVSSECSVDRPGAYVVLRNAGEGAAALRGLLALEFIQPNGR
jgi:hypothetical protein